MNNKSEINIKFVTVRCVNLTKIYCFLELGNTRPTRERERERESESESESERGSDFFETFQMVLYLQIQNKVKTYNKRNSD